MPRLDLTSLRYFLSLLAILAGAALLIYVLIDSGSGDKSRGAQDTTASVRPTAAVAQPTAVLAATTLPPSPPLVKSTAEDCIRGWRYIDNSQQRWTICMPVNLLYFDGKGVLPFESASPEDWQKILKDFAATNEPWYLAQDLQTRATADYLGPLSLKVEVAPPTLAIEGCDPRKATPNARGVVSCTDRLFLQANGGQAINPDGSYFRLRAMVPTRSDVAAKDVFSLYLTVYGYSVNATQQEAMLNTIVETLKPY